MAKQRDISVPINQLKQTAAVLKADSVIVLVAEMWKLEENPVLPQRQAVGKAALPGEQKRRLSPPRPRIAVNFGIEPESHGTFGETLKVPIPLG